MPGRPVTRPGPGPCTRGVLAGLSAVLLLTGCSGSGDAPAGTASGPSTPAPALTSSSEPAAPDPTDVASAVDALLTRREAALVAGDADAFAATVLDPGTDTGRRQVSGLAAARALRVTRLTHDVVAPVDDPRAVDVTLRYRLAGTDRGERTARVRYAVVDDGPGWRVDSELALDGEPAPPWVAMPELAVRRTAHAVVAGTAGASALDEAARTVDREVPVLRRGWSGTPAHVLVLVPDTVAEAAALGASGDGPGRVAATTDGPLDADGRATADRVLLDPQARRRLTTVGRDVVLTHELAHVAVRATVPGTTPTWLSEGYADHVGYARADVPRSALLAPLVAAVREGSAPDDLPSATSLDPSVGDIEVAYLAAWQAAELVVERRGEAGLRRLVQRCTVTGPAQDAERTCDAAMPSVLGTDRAGFTRLWRQRLAALSR
ncbi:hypothetical protein G7075_05320 [Phycicoccus sp. HDW14]|uniref:hypothetical protein n=1 Tax=Phycicoccus sp. HDW14 TaxID=2714941 RepID=UPI00140D77EA|nr:hypothetical protein [Phycicoccus sp. HDW14]QIM20703.1 hypothetical protein G7075_05320 [Phycicoccus sp. HDW14]